MGKMDEGQRETQAPSDGMSEAQPREYIQCHYTNAMWGQTAATCVVSAAECREKPNHYVVPLNLTSYCVSALLTCKNSLFSNSMFPLLVTKLVYK